MFLYFLVYCFLLYFVGHVCCLLGEGADYENLQDQQFDIPEQIQYEGKCPWPYVLLFLFYFELE